MFLFSVLGDILELGGALFLAGYLWQDYRHGWPGVKALADKSPELFDKFSFGFLTLSGEGNAQKRLKKMAKELHRAREEYAEVQTIAEEFRKKEGESLQLGTEAEECAQEAVQAGDGDLLEGIVKQKLAVEKAAIRFRNAAETAEGKLQPLRDHLLVLESQYQDVQLEVGQINIDNAIGALTERVYQITSQVSEHGYSDSGEIEGLKKDAEHRRIKAENMLSLVQATTQKPTYPFLENKIVQAEIQKIKDKVAALPAPGAQTPELEVESDLPESGHRNGLIVSAPDDAEIVQPLST